MPTVKNPGGEGEPRVKVTITGTPDELRQLGVAADEYQFTEEMRAARPRRNSPRVPDAERQARRWSRIAGVLHRASERGNSSNPS